MPEKSSSLPPIDFHHDRFTQISESHCGPAVIQMLLYNLGIEVTQEAIAEAGEATGLIEESGMHVGQLKKAVWLLAPQTIFWYKDHANIDELVRIVDHYKYPVGVEWQGVFEDSLEDETQDADYGHYSMVTAANPKEKKLMIVDPYKDFRSQDRVFDLSFFMTRWWDTNDYPDPITGKDHYVEDRQMMFIITPRGVTFPKKLGMKRE